jgi:hypothetical protein
MRSVAVLLGVIGAGLLGLAVFTFAQGRTLAFTLGVPKGAPVAPLRPNDVVCQGPLAVPDDAAAFDGVAFQTGTYRRPGPPLEVTVEPATGGRPIARGALAAGYRDVSVSSVEVGHVATRSPIRVCVRNRGVVPAGIYGAADAASRTSTASLNGQPLNADVSLVFEREHARSLASLVPAMLDRAALFRASWLGGWAYALLALVVVLGIPALLALALRDARTAE